jgi:hypothetical protein
MSERTQAEYRCNDPDAQIALIVARWTLGWNAHDADVLASLVAADVDFVNVRGQWLRGERNSSNCIAASTRLICDRALGPPGNITCAPWQAAWCSFTLSGQSMVN